MAGVAAIHGVDNTLRDLTAQAVAGLNPTVGVTVGPLDRDDDRSRLNWFLYRVTPNAAYRNMEPPRTGWRSAYGCPPLALQLHYLLSAHPSGLTQNGEEDQFAHRALGAAMQALHDNGILATGNPVLSSFALPLVEPLRISLEELDVEALTKLWTAATKPIRLAVGYEVSLVVIEATRQHEAGPPVRTPRVAVVPSMGPRLAAVDPVRLSAGASVLVTVNGLTGGTAFFLDPDPADPPLPPGATGWALAPAPAPAPPGRVGLVVPAGLSNLAPGPRALRAVDSREGLPFGADLIGVTLVPAVTAPIGSVARGATLLLATAHAAADVEVFLNGARVPAADVDFLSATQVQLVVPAAATPGPGVLVLRAGKVSGPDAPVTVT
jgi:hypothetical protein